MADAVDGAMKVLLYAQDTAGAVTNVIATTGTGLRVHLGNLISGEDTRNNALKVNRQAGYEHISSTAAGTIGTVTCGATGSAGDILERLIVVNTLAAANQLKISGNGNEAIPVLPAAMATATYTIDLGLVSSSAGWRVTPATGQDVLAIGFFT